MLRIFFLIIIALLFISCSRAPKAVTPLETLKLFTAAQKKKDVSGMKAMLSKASLKMAEDDAKQRNIPLDESILNETLIGENVTSVEFKNEKIIEDKATIEVKNSFGIWDIVNFVKEDGSWKIDKQGFVNDLEKQVNDEMKQLDDQINQGRKE